MSTTRILALSMFLAAVLVFCAGLILHVRENAGPADVSDWTEEIRTLGGVRAYAKFAGSVSGRTPEEQHTGAHAFGSALYLVEGESGLFVCDSQFSFGCFHEFLGRAIADLGIASVQRLNQGCVDALGPTALSCQHGIGHGVQAYFGYTADALQEALPVCRDLPYNDPIGGCYGGVFMEYNLQTMLGQDGRIRVASDDDVLEPCSSLVEEYRTACVFWQVQWWHQRMKEKGRSEEEIFPTLGQLCNRFGASYRRTCYEGIGNITAPVAGFDGRRVALLCDSTSDSAVDRLLCRSFAANSLAVGGAGKKGDAKTVCEDLAGEYRTFCDAYAVNTGNILHSLFLPSE